MKQVVKQIVLSFWVLITLMVSIGTSPLYAAAKWTFMVYLDADNNLESAGIDDFLEMAKAGSTSDIQIIVQMDRIAGDDSRYGNWTTCKRFRVTRDMEPYADRAIQDIGEANMGDPETLKGFINWTVSAYPADRYALILWDHGSGWHKKRDAEPVPVTKAVCTDDTNNYDSLAMQEIKTVLNALSVKPRLIGFDACLMSMMENAYLLRDSGAEVMTGSEENEPGSGWPYHLILQGLISNPSWTPAQLGSWIVSKYYESYENFVYGKGQTQAAVDLSKASALAASVSDLAITLKTSWSSDKAAVKSAAQTVMNRVKDAVIISKCGADWRGAEGLSIYFPTNAISQGYYGTSFAVNTQWDEFLNVYLTSMKGSWIESARNKTVYFAGEDHSYFPYIDLHHFCSLLVSSADTSPGYSVQQTTYNFDDISSTGVRASVNDESYARISPIGFTFSFYDTSYTSFSVSDNGVIYFQDSKYYAYENKPIPGSTDWNGVFLAPYWDDFGGAAVYWLVKGTSADKRLIIQWQDVVPYDGENLNGGSFQAILYESGRIIYQYRDTDFGDIRLNSGASATVGLQGTSERGIQYAHNSQKLPNQTAVLFIPTAQGTCSYLLSSSEKLFSSAGGDAAVTVSAAPGCGWTASSNASWITITEGKTGSGNGTVKFTTAQHTGVSPRTGTMTIAGQTFTVSQSAPCSFDISPIEKSFTASGGSGMISVTASAAGCTWQALSQSSWISVTSGTSGTGNGTVWYAAAANYGDRRTGTITAAGRIFTVVQEAGVDAAILTNGAAVKNLSLDLGGRLFYKVSIPQGALILQVFTQGGTGNANLYVKFGQTPSIDQYDFKSDNSGNNEIIQVTNPQSGDWFILVHAFQTFGGVSLTAAYTTQTCSYTLSPSSLNLPSSGGSGSFNVTTDTGCVWTAASSVSWLQISGSISNTGSGKLDFLALPNTDQTSRTGTLTVKDKTVTVTQEGQPAQVQVLTNGTPTSPLSGETNSAAFYKVFVPVGQSELKIQLWGGSGDADLYVRYGQIPTSEFYDGLSESYDTNESVVMVNPQSGDWYVMIYGYAAYSGVYLKAAYSAVSCAISLLQTEVTMESAGGTGTISVVTDSGCQWNAVSKNDWITIPSGNSGFGNGTVSYSVSPNSNVSDRTGTIDISGQLVFILQKGTSSSASLSNGIPITGISAPMGSSLYYVISVPEEQKILMIDSWGGIGDVDMYVRYGSPPSDVYDYQCYSWGNTENIFIRNPQAGNWYILLYAYDDFSGVSVKGAYYSYDCDYTLNPISRMFPVSGGEGLLSVSSGGGCPWTAVRHGSWIDITSDPTGTGGGSVSFYVYPNSSPSIRANNIRIADQWMTVAQAGTVQTSPFVLTNGVSQTISGNRGETTYYQIDVLTGAQNLSISLSGGEGDADLYIRRSDLPTFRISDVISNNAGSDDVVTIENPPAGVWYVMISGYSAYSGVTLKAEYTKPLCAYSLSEAGEISLGSSGGTRSITVTSNSGCSWNAVSESDWLTITSGNSGSGPGTVTFSAASNSSLNERIGVLRIADIPVTIRQQGTAAVTTLSNGVSISGLSGVWGDSLFFKFVVPPGQKNLIIDTWGGTGDADLYASKETMPTDTVYDFRCYAWGNDENIYVKNPEPGVWYVLIYGYDSFSDLIIKASVADQDCNYTVYPMKVVFDAAGGTGGLSVSAESGCDWTAIKHGSWIKLISELRGSGSGGVSYTVPQNVSTGMRANNIRIADQWITVIQKGTVQNEPDYLQLGIAQLSTSQAGVSFYQMDIPDGEKNLLIETFGGSGYHELFVRYGEIPTYRIYDRSIPASAGADKTVSIQEPRSGKWYVMLSGAFSDVSLRAITGMIDLGSISNLERSIILLQIVSGLTPSISGSLLNFDTYWDGKIGLEDAVYHLQYAAGLRIATPATRLNAIKNDK